MNSQLVRRGLRLQSQVSLVKLVRPLQTSAMRSITKSCNVEDVHVAETENEAANEFLGVRFNATKIKKYSAELEVDGRTITGGDFWTPVDAAKAYDRLVALHGDETMSRNFT
ncbi:Iojap-like ribosome-associated protein [Phytophthora palmivora]|uniref:Iojap-like ribosome-associated protein n=1 Tax=Phytophthora palmivora TaxID=4796 RepID=A0A2P4XPI5_9STRA|nr:Iojap-like ribosome-associated protein [Phytophthora palmivora]POM67458.1 Iojap-like ribosome-associated protein [Phytophthora palmivora]